MKLKEIPVSIYHTLKLKSLSSKKLYKLKPNSIPVIVSLTTIPYRLKKVHITIRSILNQVEPPQKIVLWLNESNKDHVPKSLKKLEGSVFSIEFSQLDCPHLKLVETLKKFPESIVATCDDDYIYDKEWLSNLYKNHLQNPNHIIAHCVREIQYDKSNKLLPYKEWTLKNSSNTKSFLAIGSHGVLYPPNSLHPAVTEETLFLKLAPKADDLWLKAMTVLQGTEIKPTNNSAKSLVPVFDTQKISLKKENIDNNLNVKQWENLTAYFNLDIEQFF